VLRCWPRGGDETLSARDKDVCAEIAAGRIDVGTHDPSDDGEAGNIATTKCTAGNAGRHFIGLNHDTDRGGARYRWIQRWLTATGGQPLSP
jgi:hypothetical protein